MQTPSLWHTQHYDAVAGGQYYGRMDADVQ